MTTVFDGQGVSNGTSPPQPGRLPRGQSSLDVIIEGGFLPIGSGPVEYAAWLREPINAIIGDLDAHIDSRFTVLWAPFVGDMTTLANGAAASAAAALTSENNAETAEAAALAAQAAAEAAAALVTGGVMAAGFISGLECSPDAGDPIHDIAISAGQCRSSNNANDIVLAAPLVKRLDAVWAAGTGNGGRDVATALAAGQTWFVHVVQDNAGPTVDAVFSLSPTAPTLPAAYDVSRLVCALPPLGSTASPPSGTDIPYFIQHPDGEVELKTPNAGFVGQSGNASPMLKDWDALPYGIAVEAKIFAQANYDGTTTHMVFKNPTFGVPSAFGGTDQWSHIRLSTAEKYLTAIVRVWTNTSAQCYVHISQAGATWAAKVVGYRWDRRKL